MNYGYPNPTNTAGQLFQQGMNVNPMYGAPYSPTAVQSLTMQGATALGYQGAQALPYVAAGQRVYDNMYAAQTVAPLYQTLNQNVNRRVGQMMSGAFANAAGMGPAGSRTAMLNYGESPAGQMLAGSLQSSGALNGIMGGDIRGMYTSMFAGRNELAFGPGQMINPNSPTQAKMAAQYTNMLADSVSGLLFEGGSPIVSNKAITSGRGIEQIGSLANAMALLDPQSSGMSQQSLRILDNANRDGKSIDELEPEKLKVVQRDVDRRAKKIADTMEALSGIGDVLGQTEVLETLSTVNDAFGGQFFQLSGKSMKQFAANMSAAEKVYGVTGSEQLGMMSTLGTTLAMRSGAVNPVTGRIDSANIPVQAQLLAQHAMATSAQTGMSPQDALAHTNMLVDKSAQSSAGKLSQLVEAGYRTGQISKDMYDQFHSATMSGDVRGTSAAVREMGARMGQDLFKSMNDPTRMRIAERQLQALPGEARADAATAHAERLMSGAQQEMSLRGAEYNRRTATHILNNMSAKIGLSGSSLMSREAADETTYAAYRESLKASGLSETEVQKKLNLLEHTYKQSGMGGVRSMLRGTDIFENEVAGMQAAASAAKLDKQQARAGQAFERFGASGTILKNISAISRDRSTQKAVSNIKSMMRAGKTADAQVAMDQLYNSLPKAVKESVRDPKQSRKAAEMLMDSEFQQAVNRKLEKKRETDPNARWETVAQAAAKKRDVDVTDEELAIAQMSRQAAMHNASTIDMETGVLSPELAAKRGEGLAVAAGEAGYAPELFAAVASKGEMVEYADAVRQQAKEEAKVAKENPFLRLTKEERAIQFLTQDPELSGPGRMTFFDVLGVKPGSFDEMEGAQGDFLRRAKDTSVKDLKNKGFFGTWHFLRGATDEQKRLVKQLQSGAKDGLDAKGLEGLFAEDKAEKEKQGAAANSTSGREELRIVLDEGALTIKMGEQEFTGLLQGKGRGY